MNLLCELWRFINYNYGIGEIILIINYELQLIAHSAKKYRPAD